MPVLFKITADGETVFEVTVMLDVDMQPLAPVTVTVYVPDEVILAFALFPNPLFHE